MTERQQLEAALRDALDRQHEAASEEERSRVRVAALQARIDEIRAKLARLGREE